MIRNLWKVYLKNVFDCQSYPYMYFMIILFYITCAEYLYLQLFRWQCVIIISISGNLNIHVETGLKHVADDIFEWMFISALFQSEWTHCMGTHKSVAKVDRCSKRTTHPFPYPMGYHVAEMISSRHMLSYGYLIGCHSCSACCLNHLIMK